MKLLFAYRNGMKPPRVLHVFSLLAGSFVSARSYCGKVRPEGEVLSVVRADARPLNQFLLSGDEPGLACWQCRNSANYEISSYGSKDPRFERDEKVLSQLKW